MIDKLKLKALVSKYGVYAGIGAVVLLGLLTGKRKKSGRRVKRRKTTSKTVSKGSNVPSRIRTKSGKVISGRANVLAYRSKLRNLAKARRSKK